MSKAKVSSFHDAQLGFVMTFHKSQGRTMKSVIIVVPKRPREMRVRMSFEIFYVGISRVKVADDVRLLYSDADDLSFLCDLECSDYLKAWREGFVDSKGIWDPKRAKQAFEQISRRKARKAQSKATRTQKRTLPVQKDGAKKPLKRARLI